MAEMFGVVASGMSVVSLAFQVADSIKKLKDFCDLVKGAPEDIRLALDEIEAMTAVLGDIDKSIKSQDSLPPSTKNAIARSLCLCRACEAALQSLVTELQTGMTKQKRRTSLKVALTKEKLMIIKARVECSKSTLLLANQCYYHAIQHREWEIQRLDMKSLRTMVATLCQSPLISSISTGQIYTNNQHVRAVHMKLGSYEESIQNKSADKAEAASEHASLARSCECWTNIRGWLKGCFGLIEYQGTTREYQKKRVNNNYKVNLTVQFPPWIYPYRFELHLKRSYQGWDQKIRYYNIVPYEAKIFRLCVNGDVEGIQALFRAGIASPFDTDVDGRTALHYAARYARPAVCRLLLAEGADASSRTSMYGDPSIGFALKFTPLHALAAAGGNLFRCGRSALSPLYEFYNADQWCGEDEYHDTARCLIDCGDSSPSDEDGLERTVCTLFNGPAQTFAWLRKQSQTPLLEFHYSMDESMKLLMGRARKVWLGTICILRDTLPGKCFNHQIAIYANERGETLLYIFAKSWAVLRRMKRAGKYDALKEWEIVITELIELGADLSALCKTSQNDFQTPLPAIVQFLTTFWWSYLPGDNQPMCFRFGIRQWLKLLSNAKVDLEAYGRREADLLSSAQVSWTFRHGYGRSTYTSCDMQVISLSFGKEPKDFRLVWEDLYVSGGILEDFWQLIDSDSDDKLLMPGSWVD